MSIITKKGDNGYTRLFDGTKVLKSSIRPETYGLVDELFSFLGIVKFKFKNEKKYIRLDAQNKLKGFTEYLDIITNDEILYFDSLINIIQKKLMVVMSELAVKKKNVEKFCKDRVGHIDISAIEIICQELEREIGKLNSFIIPGENDLEAYLNYARALTRKVERKVIKTKKLIRNDSCIIIYLNRLSDLLFLLSLYSLRK
ncbi:MAG: ATP:cob(I)alamin adenosyltransferase [Spirochaetales bacterium]|jgi:cob(I)alamin adenosyltransferase|nr:ATP:cob(I)alamin adenosyltransferase [Exilispira sp.]NMC66865.1 ATP:cob(I)alamin adenosyltransferase [Spirochaetales bacterium]